MGGRFSTDSDLCGRIAEARWAVLLIDMQPPFVEKIAAPQRAELIACQQDLLSRCAAERIPVAVIEYADEGRTIPQLRKYLNGRHVFSPITKHHNNAFQRTSLQRQLTRRGIGGVFTAGINASACVLDTAKGASRRFAVATAYDTMADEANGDFLERSYKEFEELGLYRPRADEILDIITGAYQPA